MSRLHVHPESHLVSRIGWLRAAVLGANDRIVSTASLIVGVWAASRVFLAILGAVGARAGGANVGKATLRVTFWGPLAIALTAAIGAVFGVAA
jgi:VIT1/CCC1 family predicted Fe2+/Mn2+ transporter